MSAGTTVEKYGAVVTTVDVGTKVIEFALKTGLTRRMTLATYPDTFCWPQVGDQIMVRYENGQWGLEGWFDTEGLYQNVSPGDAVIRSTTDTLRVIGGDGWSLSPDAWPLNTTAGGDLTGFYPNPTIGPKPFWYGYWANTPIGPGALTLLNCSAVAYIQKGMASASGGCKVPMPGLYEIHFDCRVDDNTASSNPNYTEIAINSNGSLIGTANSEMGYNVNVEYQYHRFSKTQKVNLNAGDVITLSASCAGLGGATVICEAGDGLTLTYLFPYTGV